VIAINHKIVPMLGQGGFGIALEGPVLAKPYDMSINMITSISRGRLYDHPRLLL